jgi:NTP pyrophosphatase (non-canonical NTP hydrolase)
MMNKIMGMTIKDAQKMVDTWIKEKGVRYFSELTNLAVLVEEVGELSRLMARVYGDQSFKEHEDKPLSVKSWLMSSGYSFVLPIRQGWISLRS